MTTVIEREASGYVALCPELDIASQGNTIDDARRNLQEALVLFFEMASPGEVEERFHSLHGKRWNRGAQASTFSR